LRTIAGPWASSEAYRTDQFLSEFATYLNGFRWDWYVTLTHRYDTSKTASERHFVETFARTLGLRAQKPIHWFYAVEGVDDIRPHVHALLAVPPSVQPIHIHNAWGRGQTKILPYIPCGGAAGYVPKGLDDPEAKWGFSRTLPPPLSLT
jgi:hypothetical protein